MKAERTVKDELRRVERLLADAKDDVDRDTMYGAVQALSWVLGQDAAAPHVLVSDRAGAE